MKIIFKGKLSEEYLEHAAIGVYRILAEHAPSEDEIKIGEQEHNRIMNMINDKDIKNRQEKIKMYREIQLKEFDDKVMKMWEDSYWKGTRVVCALEDTGDE